MEAKPTKEQIKEFWERWGFKFSPKTEDIRFGSPQPKYSTADYWIYPDGKYHRELPPVDPNSLFKYAVPQITKNHRLELSIGRQGTYCYIFKYGGDYSIAKWQSEDTAIALFWALWMV